MLAALKFCFAALVLLCNSLLFCTLMVPLALLKLLVPLVPVRRWTDRILNRIPALWIDLNNFWLGSVNRSHWQVELAPELRPDGWYLLVCNHQSWMDILVLQRVLNRRVPMLKFFLKRELLYVPVLNLAWWALDFPFMRRGSGGGTARKDLRDAKAACEKFRHVPTTVISFAEGTRFTAAKQAQQPSPYQHLLAPKAGAVTMALGTLSDLLDGLIDVTIVYPNKVPSFMDALCGRLGDVVVQVQLRPIPPELLKAGAKQRVQLQTWLDGLWQEKDQAIGEVLAQR
ncbi:acyltransferase [Giesbergeria anulus]|uniref:1-acyl-sn-glycerol-3-phosphate acyltransferases n=1 Tax=Giesbergeria anulus TaxID=180197 RepID=A0A1H9JZ60_9BURK|nr:acyltransferase [Giesbergeria anulus]SEQ92251.1 1-acyl-sn-glycerol-3-phosphate acyltransferases [Giesbergeria anulus]